MKGLVQEFIEQSLYRINQSTTKVFSCFEELSSEDIWRRPNNASNSIGNIILHLCGNIRQYAISSLGNQPDIRERAQEFLAKDGYTKDELKNKLGSTVNEAIEIIKNSEEKSLLKIYSVQGFSLSGMGIIIHVTEHYSYHAGQIIFWTKFLKNKELGFYAGVDLSQKNKNQE